MTRFAAVAAVLAAAGVAGGQPPSAATPQHEVLKAWVGTWDATVKAGPVENKATAVYKMELGGLWQTGTFEGDYGGTKFSGRALNGYDPARKKYVGVWVDSMNTAPMVMEGDYDARTKTLTMTATHPGPDGKPARFKSVSTFPDPDTIDFGMYLNDAKEPGFTIRYTRKK